MRNFQVFFISKFCHTDYATPLGPKTFIPNQYMVTLRQEQHYILSMIQGTVHILRNYVMGSEVKVHLMTMIMPPGGGW